MTSRDRILARLRQNRPPEHPLPAVDDLVGTRYEDPAAQFALACEAVAGTCGRIADRSALADLISERYPEARKIMSTLPEVPGVSKSPSTSPSEFESDLLVAQGNFGVAENAAVWVDGNQFPHQSCLYLCERLVLVIGVADLVHNMHEAYARLAAAEMPPYGVFVSGPSKTADIEQTLVIGAQGARSCHVVLLEN